LFSYLTKKQQQQLEAEDEVVLGESERRAKLRKLEHDKEVQRQNQNVYTVGLQITEPDASNFSLSCFRFKHIN
jgi:hypothetical protein